MNKKIRTALMLVLALTAILLITSCSDSSFYDKYDDEGYSVSIRYDANGGILTDGVTTIVDTYGLGTLPEENGMKIAQLIAPENTDVRGSVNKFKPRKNGYTCVGWYAERTEVVDEDGNTSYTYSKKWDFENDRLVLDPSKEYSASEPYMTLYAAWVPNFSFEFYSIDDPDTVLGTVDNVSVGGKIEAPIWDESDDSLYLGALEDVIEKNMAGKTFIAVYTDAERTQRLTGDSIVHQGTINYENATALNPTMKLYIEAWEGEWIHVYKPNKLVKKFDLNGNYVIMEDLDLRSYNEILEEYEYQTWPTTNINGEFTGKIVGLSKENGEPVKISNVNFKQTSSSTKGVIGMFGRIGEGAVLKNIYFEEACMTIDKGSPMVAKMSFGLLAGSIDDGAEIENVSISGVIKISSKCSFRQLAQVSVGLVCGSGNRHGIAYNNVRVEKLDKVDSFDAVIVDDMIELDFPNAN